MCVSASNTQTQFEVGLGILTALGLPQGSFKGALYRPGAAPARIASDPCCQTPTPAPTSATDTEGEPETALAMADTEPDSTEDTSENDTEFA